mmetsp:Transcript_42505/g.99561  ORF Transcript_42505/g.99561 Transcript_42505/m.99561 type:complete len:127 (+) Transcript_42505:17-397(+)
MQTIQNKHEEAVETQVCGQEERNGERNDERDGERNLADPIDDFDRMGLREALLRGIYSHGFEKPTPIQQRAIKPLSRLRDTIAQAQSGTGKTGAFAIGVPYAQIEPRREASADVPRRLLRRRAADD